jgi:competence protein ComEC
VKLINFTVVKLTIFLIVGIIVGYFFPISLIASYVYTGGTLLLLLVFYLRARTQFKQHIGFGILTYMTFVGVGILILNLKHPKYSKYHYTHYCNSSLDTVYNIAFRIQDILKSNSNYNTYTVQLLSLNSHKVNGKVLLKLRKDSSSTLCPVDHVYLIKTQLLPIQAPLNPGAFNYKNYLERRYIYHKINSEAQLLYPIASHTTTHHGWAYQLRNHIQSKLQTLEFSPDNFAIINALFLGQRQYISQTLHYNYTNAGVIHILALSGLHIGIILWFLNVLLKPIEYYKRGKTLKLLLIVMVLWGFAFCTGLSVSVTRSVTMFSIVALGMHLKRPTNIYNTLTVSIFILLLYNPLFLMDAGFQLSYLAVFAIVSIAPILYNLWQPRYWIVDKYWRILTVTIAAQIGVLPISLYYFHQFTALSFVSNLVILPVLGLIIGYGILIIILSVANLFPYKLALLYNSILNKMNAFISWTAQHDEFILKHIPFNLSYLLLVYVFIIAVFKYCITSRYVYLKLSLYTVIALSLAFCFTIYHTPKQQFVVFHKQRSSILVHTHNAKTTVYSHLDTTALKHSKLLKDFKIYNHDYGNFEKDTIKSVYILGVKKLLIIDHLGIYKLKRFKPDYIMLRQSPKINLERLIALHRPLQIIADGSNYRSSVKSWQQTCTKLQVPFHYTGEKGAFQLRY